MLYSSASRVYNAFMKTGILDDGYRVVTFEAHTAHAMSELVDATRAFFELPHDARAHFKFKDHGYLLGLRDPYDENGEVAGNPYDLNSSFTYMHDQLRALRCNGRWSKAQKAAGVEAADRAERLVQAGAVMMRSYTNIGSQILREQLELVNPRINPEPFTADQLMHHSWIQLNELIQGEVPRELGGRAMGQYVHNDGHLITFGSSDVAGLELVDHEQATRIYNGQQDPNTSTGIPAELGFDRATVFAGDILADLVNGTQLGGMPHQVRNNGIDRLSVICFINPYFEFKGLTLPRWNGRGEIEGDRWACYQSRFGLPRICSNPEA